MKKSIWSCLAISLLASSCHTYKEYDKDSFPTYTWARGQEIVFNPTIEDISKTYQLTLGVRHVYGLQLEAMRVTVKVVSPSGKETSKNYELALMNSRKEYISSCAGDMCDLEAVVDENVKFGEAGQYKYIVTHDFQAERVPGVMEFGIIIDEQD